MEFKYQIGDMVASLMHIEEIKRYTAHTDLSPRPEVHRVEERISIECVGGTQLFYGCRTRNGEIVKLSQDSMVPAEHVWTAWVDGIDAQEERKKAR